jgi:hypothetical protein
MDASVSPKNLVDGKETAPRCERTRAGKFQKVRLNDTKNYQ